VLVVEKFKSWYYLIRFKVSTYNESRMICFMYGVFPLCQIFINNKLIIIQFEVWLILKPVTPSWLLPLELSHGNMKLEIFYDKTINLDLPKLISIVLWMA